MCATLTSMCYVAARLLFAVRVEYNVRVYRLVRVFNNIGLNFLLDTFTSLWDPRMSTVTL